MISFASLFAVGVTAALSFAENPETGAITNLTVAGDATGMNWVHVADGTQYAWIGPQYGWGTGTLKADGQPCDWRRPGRLACGVEIRRERRLVGGILEERYAFRNVTDRPLALSEIDIHTPFNDNYPKATADMFLRRCHAHIWAGGAGGWVSAMRIGGRAPHLGLVVTEGSLAAYGQKERALEKGMSNVRGVLTLSPADVTLKPGEETAIAWKVFAHGGWDDFPRQVVALGSLWVTADRYVARTGEKVRISAKAADGDWTKEWTCSGPGEHRVEIACGARRSHVEVLGVDDPEALLLARARYIVKHQQINEPGSPYDGALVPYDPNLRKQERRWLPEWQGLINVDHSEGGERMGMGVFLAQMAQRGHTEFVPPLLRYYSFVRNRLQEPDYTSWQDVTRPSRKRAFNYPWFIRFYLEMYGLTGERQYLADAFGTLRRLFSGCVVVPDCLVEFPIGRLVTALRQAGMSAEADEAVALLRKYLEPAATFDVEKVVTHEVMIAPEMVSGSFGQLLEFHAVTGEARYLAAAEKWRPVAEAICGRQPSWHTKDIGMHHWDGRWFGRNRQWGDTLPHDWNGHMATAFREYAAATGERTYAARSRGIADAMLGLFQPDGRATCAWIYTDRVNGKPAKGPDPLMNDQDWAAVYYLENTPPTSRGKETLKVSSLGFDPVDSTRFLQAAFDSGAKRVVVDRQASDWIALPLFLTNSNVEVVLEDGVNLVAKRGAFHGHDDSLVYIGKGATNVTLRGEGKATLRMHKADYLNPAMHYTFSGGHRMTVDILKSQGATVRNLTILSSGGDGVYVGGGAKDVLLEDLVCRDHKRQGISITDAVGCTVRRCAFDETLGTPPTCGVDIEPNSARNDASEILFEDCTFNGNGAHGIDLYFGCLTARTRPVSIVFRRCVAKGNSGSGISFMTGNPKNIVECGQVKGTVLFEDCLIAGNGQEAVKIINHTVDGMDIRFRNCRFDAHGQQEGAALSFSNAQLVKDFGGLAFENCRVDIDAKTAVCDFEAQTGVGIAGTLSGSLAVDRAGRSETFELGAFAARHVPHPERIAVFRAPSVDYRALSAPSGTVRGVYTPAIRESFVYVQAVPAAGEYTVRFKSRKLRKSPDATPCGVVQLLDRAGTDLGKFSIPAGDFAYVIKARGPDVYRFEVAQKNASTISVASETPGGGLLTDRPIDLFGGKNVTFHFRVPAAAREVWVDVRPEEPGSAELLDASGRKVAEAPYQRKMSCFRIGREPTGTDEIWTLRFPNIQEDLRFQVGGDAVPLLSTEEGGVIR